MSRFADVGIVGLGPAGARAAELLAGQGVDVVAFDPRVPWEKPCGGGLTSKLFEEFPELEEVKSLAHPVERARIELSPEIGFDVKLDSRVWMISREVLGRWQLDRALGAGVMHESARVETIRTTGEGWTLDTDRGAWEIADLIGADGAASGVRHAVAPGFSIELVPARVAYPRAVDGVPDFLVLRFYSGLVGYLWDFPRLDHHSVGIEVTSGGCGRGELDEKIDEYREQSGSDPVLPPPRAGAVIGTAQLGHGDFSQISGPGFALLGDAAGFVDPLTGEGIRNALRSADLLARARDTTQDAWAEAYSALARQTFSREFAFARLLRRSLSESGAGMRLVEWALSSDVAYAAAAAVLNALTTHEHGLSRLPTLWYRAIKSIRAHPDWRDPRGLHAADATR